MGDEIKVYRGWLTTTGNGEEYDLLGLGVEEDNDCYILAELISDDLGWPRQRQVSVRYFVTDEPVNADTLNSELASLATGDSCIRYGMAYSEITGYLWTNEDLIVGGHDLIEELSSHKGKFLHLEVTFHGD